MHKHVSSVFVATLLFVGLVAGAGVATAATDGAGLAQAETPTDDSPATPAEATVTMENQTVADGTVTVTSATLPEGGFVAIHGQPGNVVGVSGYLAPGTHEDVQIQLDQQPDGERSVGAAVHQDTNGNEAFDFTGMDSTTDIPYMTVGEPISDEAGIQPAAGDDEPADETDEDTDGDAPDDDGNETDGEEPVDDGNQTDGDAPADDGNQTDGEAPADDGNETDGEAPADDGNQTDGEEPVDDGNETDGEAPADGDTDDSDADDGVADDGNETDGDAPDEDVVTMGDEVTVVLDGAPDGLRTYSVTVDVSEDANATIEGVEADLLSNGKLQVTEQSEQSISFRAADLSDAVGAFDDSRSLATVNLSERVDADDVSVTVDRLVADDDSEIAAESVSLEIVGDLFVHPLPGSAADTPPMDLDGDGLYEDVDGDGQADFGDAITLAFVDHEDLSEDQRAALDFNGDGELSFGDAIELAFTV